MCTLFKVLTNVSLRFISYLTIFSDLSVIEGILNQVKQIYDRIKLAQRNVKDLLSNILTWANQPLYERKEGKKENLLCLDDRAERIQKRVDIVSSCSNELQRIVKDNCVLFLNKSLEEKPPETEELTDAESSPKPPEPEEKKDRKGMFLSFLTT